MSDAVKALKKATQIDPSFATAHHNLALCLKQMGNTSACIEHTIVFCAPGQGLLCWHWAQPQELIKPLWAGPWQR